MKNYVAYNGIVSLYIQTKSLTQAKTLARIHFPTACSVLSEDKFYIASIKNKLKTGYFLTSSQDDMRNLRLFLINNNFNAFSLAIITGYSVLECEKFLTRINN